MRLRGECWGWGDFELLVGICPIAFRSVGGDVGPGALLRLTHPTSDVFGEMLVVLLN